MQSSESPSAGATWISRVYPVGFVVVVLAVLSSFLAIPDFSPATLSENFHWRAQLIQYFNTARMMAGDRLFNAAVIADKGWIMVLGDESIPEYQHTNRMTRNELKAVQANLSDMQAYLQKQRRTFLVVIPPDKSTIYGPQHMPAQIPVFQGGSRLDQFENYMRAHSTVQILDLRAALSEASKTEDVYYHTDTHWNDAGAYVGYVEILKALSAEYPSLQAHPKSDFNRYYAVETRDLPPIMGIPQVQEGSWYLRPKSPTRTISKWISLHDGRVLGFTSAAGPNLPSLLLLHDSFYDIGLYKFLELHFGLTVAVPTSGDPAVWSADWVRMVPSDIVMIEVTERFLDHLVSMVATFDK